MKFSTKTLSLMLLISCPALRIAAMEMEQYDSSIVVKQPLIWVRDTEFVGPTKKHPGNTQWIQVEAPTQEIAASKLEASVLDGSIKQEDAQQVLETIVQSNSDKIKEDLDLKNIAAINIYETAKKAAQTELLLLTNQKEKTKRTKKFVDLDNALAQKTKLILLDTPKQTLAEQEADVIERINTLNSIITDLTPKEVTPQPETQVENQHKPSTPAVTMTIWQRIFGK